MMRRPTMMPSGQPRFWLMLLAGWLVVALQLLALYWAGTAETLLDTDDAMRLVEVRNFLNGQGWFDLSEPRIAGGYESHWSRLIDVGLAGLYLLARPFVDVAAAERFMRTAWPLLWLLAVMSGAAAIAWRMGGRAAALASIVLAIGGLPALQQFKPGSIDHHNVQIALAVLTTAATVWSDRVRWAAYAAGALTGLALAIGLETLPYLAVCGAAFAIRFMVDRAAAAAVRAYGLALAAGTLMAFFVAVAPSHWSRSVCDAIAVNLAAPVVLGGWLLHATAPLLARQATRVRCAALMVIGAAVLTLFIAIEPRCIAGPFAMVDPAIRPIWLAHVQEMQPFTEFARAMPVRTAAIITFPLVALIAVGALMDDRRQRRDFGFLAAAAVFAVAFVTTGLAIKAYNYPMWLGMPFVAAIALRMCAALKLDSVPARLAASVILGPIVLSTAVVGLAQAAVSSAPAKPAAADRSACFRIDSYAALARLPAGLIVTDIDFGPFILALTPHSVVAAPYHRLSTGLITSHDTFASPVGEAHRLLDQAGATYLVTCGSSAPAGIDELQRRASLWHRLQIGAVPDWLEPMAVPGPFAVFRIRH